MRGALSSRREKASGLILQVKPRGREKERKKERTKEEKKERKRKKRARRTETSQSTTRSRKKPDFRRIVRSQPLPETVTIRHGFFVKQPRLCGFSIQILIPDQEVCVTQFVPPKLVTINRPKTERTLTPPRKSQKTTTRKNRPKKEQHFVRQKTQNQTPKIQRVRGESLIPHYS